MRARRSLPHLFFVPTLVIGLSSIASKCSDDPLSLGHDKRGVGGSDNDGGGGAANANGGGTANANGGGAANANGGGAANANGGGAANANGGGAANANGGGAANAGGGGSDPCPRSACGPQLGLPNFTCSDGSTGGPTGRCLPRANGTCGWEIRECPSSGGTGTSDGGKVTRVDGGANPCSDIEDTIRTLIAEHQSCTTTDDCRNVALYCLPGSRCTGTQYVNQTVDQSAFTTLQRELNMCLTGDPNQLGCARCFIADPVSACLNGTCGPAPQ